MKMNIARVMFLCVSLITGVRSLQAGVERGWDFYKEREYQQAAAAFEKAIADGHDEAATREGLGWCYYWLGRYDNAEEAFKNALAKDPTLPGAAKGLAEVSKWRYLPFNNAWQLFYNSDYSSAIALFQQILDDQTNRLPAGEIWKVHSGMGWCQYNLNNFTEAEKSFRNILNIYKSNEFALKGLGFTLYRLGRYSEAETVLLETLELHPEWSDTQSILGWNYYAQNQFKQAEEAFGKALAVDACYSDALYGSGWTSLRLGNDSAAHDFFHKAAMETPYHPSIYDVFTHIDKTEAWWDLYNDFGWSYYKQGDYTSAASTFTAGLARLPGNQDLLRGLGFCHFKQGDYPAALEVLNQVDEASAELQPVVESGISSDGTEYTVRSNTLSIIAWCKYYGGAIEESAELFRNNLETHGDWTDLHTGLAWCALKLNNLDTADTHLDNALKLNPSYTVALQGKQEIRAIRYAGFNAAWSSYYSGLYQEAVTDFQKVISEEMDRLDPGDQWQVYSGLGASQLELNQFKEAVEAYDKCLALQPDNPYCLTGKARAKSELKEYSDAETLARKALEKDPDSASNRALLGWILVEQQKLNLAKAEFDKALALHAGEVDAMAGLGIIAFLNGDNKTARDNFEAALAINPENKQSLEGLKQIEEATQSR